MRFKTEIALVFVTYVALSRQAPSERVEEKMDTDNRIDFPSQEDLERSVEGLKEKVGSEVAEFTCDICKKMAEYLSDLLQEDFTENAVAVVAAEGCKVLQLYPPHICDLAILEWNETFFWILDHSVFQPDQLCGLVFSDCGSPIQPPSKWNLTFPSTPKPPYKPMVRPSPSAPTLKVLFLTDFHIDPDYFTGAKVDCGDPLCCREADGQGSNASDSAPKWGALGKCDVPPRTLNTLFDQISSEKFDLVLFTGDISPHDVYNQTKESQLYLFNLTYSILMRYFPDTPVLSTFGNHEANPVDQFPPPFYGPDELKYPMNWLYSTAVEHYRYWMPPSTLATIQRGGFWSWEVVPGLKVISLNTNYGSDANWYLRIVNEDVAGQIQWLIDELQDAEDNNLRVWIICHHPDPTVEDFKQWLYITLKRYSGTIATLFYGHSHLDDFNVYYDSENNFRPILSGIVGAGVTGYRNDHAMNFGFQIVTTDGVRKGSTFGVLDFEARILNLTETQLTGTPIWQKEYSMRETYNLKSLFPEDYAELVTRMKANSTLTKLFYHYKYKSSLPFDSCDESCINSTIDGVQISI